VRVSGVVLASCLCLAISVVPSSAEPLIYQFTGDGVTGYFRTDTVPFDVEFSNGGSLTDTLNLSTQLQTAPSGAEPWQNWWFDGPWFTDSFPITNSFAVGDLSMLEQSQHEVTWTKSFDGINFMQMAGLKVMTVTDSAKWKLPEGSYSVFDGARVESVTRVPEPATLTLLGFGVVSLVGFRRRR
jgi:hypothetical protein